MIGNILIPAVSLVFCLAAVFACRFYINRELNRAGDIIGSFLSNRTVRRNDVAETRESKLISQLNQLLKLTEHEIRMSCEEKETVSRLISDLSHQLKTPLANITMYTEILREGALTEEEMKEFILRTGEQAAKMEWLLAVLLKTSRLESGIIEFEAVPEYIKGTIAESIGAVYGQSESRNIRVMIEEFADRKLIHNRKWTAEAIANILDNAIKYSPCDSTVTINITPMELYTRIQIEDQGIGIAPEEFNLIFKRFYRSKQVETMNGTGLGLYLSQLILAKQGGYITVDSQPGKGSAFSVFLKNE